MRDCTNCIHVNVCRIHRSIHAAAGDFEQLLPIDACHEQIGYGRHKFMLDRITPAISEGCRFWQAGEPADANRNIQYDRATGQPTEELGTGDVRDTAPLTHASSLTKAGTTTKRET